MNLKRYLLALFFLLPMFNCVKIDSVKSPEFNQKVNKIFVILKGPHRSRHFIISLEKHLNAEFTEHGLDVKSKYLKPLSLETADDLKSQMTAFNPDLILHVIQTEVRSVNGMNSGGAFELAAYPLGSEKPVWKAFMDSETGNAGVGNVSQVAKKIISQMIADGLISPK